MQLTKYASILLGAGILAKAWAHPGYAIGSIAKTIDRRSSVIDNPPAKIIAKSKEASRSASRPASIQKRSNLTDDLPFEVVLDFPTATWIENLAVRSNGQIIVTEDLVPRMYQIDPFTPREPTLIHEFNGTAAILGIVETSPDIFYVNSGNCSLQTLKGFGEAYIFKVDMRNFSVDQPGSAVVSKVAALPQAQVLDGLVHLGGDSSLFLTADIILGVIWSIDIQTGESRIAINSTYTRSNRAGVDGLKVHNDFLYFTNVDQQTLVKVAINARGEATGNFTVLAQGGFSPDDLAFNARGDMFVTDSTEGSAGILFVPQDGGATTHFVSGMAGATACAFGRTAADDHILYVTTNGGIEEYLAGGPVTVSGKVLKVDVGLIATVQ